MKQIGRISSAVLVLILCTFVSLWSQEYEFINIEQNPKIFSEYLNDAKWTYIPSEKYIIGMSIQKEKNTYGKFYQVYLMIYNKTDHNFTFDPEEISAVLTKGSKIKELKVYSYKKFQRKMNRQDLATSIAYGLSAGINTGVATYNNPQMYNALTYTQISNLANMESLMKINGKLLQQGYIRKTTTHPDECLLGLINVAFKKGDVLTINVSVEDQIYSFNWDLKKKRK